MSNKEMDSISDGKIPNPFLKEDYNDLYSYFKTYILGFILFPIRLFLFLVTLIMLSIYVKIMLFGYKLYSFFINY